MPCEFVQRNSKMMEVTEELETCTNHNNIRFCTYNTCCVTTTPTPPPPIPQRTKQIINVTIVALSAKQNRKIGSKVVFFSLRTNQIYNEKRNVKKNSLVIILGPIGFK